MKKLSFLFIALLLLVGGKTLTAQDITGIWRGTFYNEYEFLFTGAKYRYEVQITSNGNDVDGFTPMKGVTYSYQNTRFYGKAAAVGRWGRGSRDLTLVETKMMDLKIEGGGDGCLMTCYLRWRKEGEREFLEGTYTSVNMKNDTMSCGGGVVRLEKVTDSDFKKEDFLEKKTTPNPSNASTKPGQTEYLIKKPSAPTAKTTKPAVTKPPVKTSPNTGSTSKTTPKPPAKPAPKPDNAAGTGAVKTNKPATGTAKKTATNNSNNTGSGTTAATPPPSSKPAVVPPVAKPTPEPSKPVVLPTPSVLKNRKKELVEEITTASRKLEISFYDNGEIDGDTISVFANNLLVVSKKGLSAEPITITVMLGENDVEQELVMVAENLGSIPPNTALMIVQAGTQRYAVRLSSNEQKNAVVRFRYDPNALK